ncbi:hypothetical protein ACFX13_020847 [Malus domestica]
MAAAAVENTLIGELDYDRAEEINQLCVTLQSRIMSNGEYKAALHRVLANAYHEPRVSVAVFFSPGTREDTYGPLPELVSPVKLALIPSVYSCRVHAKVK